MRSPIVLPDLGPAEVTFSLWLVTGGDQVYEGDRVAEVLVAEATVDVLSPTDGRVDRMLVQPGQRLHPGEALGFIRDDSV